MAVKKSELYSSLWKACDALRGGMDASQYKDYILVLLFVKYVSDKASATSLISVPEGGSFKDMTALKGKANIGEGINKVIAGLATENDLKGIITLADFQDDDKLGKGREAQDKLSKMIAIFENPALDFSKNKAEGDDLLGDAYEYLMRKFATQSGKSKGQFYTPSEVSRVIAKIIGIHNDPRPNPSVYDPTCGSGSLLIKVGDEAHNGVSLFGQEMDNATFALAKMNTILHNQPTAEIIQGNTLASPYFLENGKLKTFDYAVSNPPFSAKEWSSGVAVNNDEYNRFFLGTPPTKNGDYAFLLHILTSLKSTGKGVVILPHGVLFRGNAEAQIRKNLVERGYIKGIIGLPANLFYGTGIPACIVILDKENAQARKGIFMIDASKGFMKDKDKNRLREQDIHKIVDTFNKQLIIEKYSRMVSNAEIEANEYNLNIPRYIDNQEPEDTQNIEGHLLGGIPQQDIEALNDYWEVFADLKKQILRETRQGFFELSSDYSQPINQAQSSIIEATLDRFEKWRNQHHPTLQAIDNETIPKKFKDIIAEDILVQFEALPLIDQYDIYEHLLVYWLDTMQDDVYLIVVDGWKAELSFNEKTKTIDCDLLPKKIVIDYYFQTEQTQINQLEAERESLIAEMDSLLEENGGEDGYLHPENFDKEKINDKSVQKRLKADNLEPEEISVLKNYLQLIEKQVKTSKKIKEAQIELEKKVIAKYEVLTENEIKKLVIDEKWLKTLRHSIQNEAERIGTRLRQRLKDLQQRYETPLPQLDAEVKNLEMKVKEHLAKMGFEFN
ncbi:MAG: type I restriction-modification system subunit M [Microscillaceae bacterium]|jgi:type I restriction enzyme M protein|nr:type I restriction-modification system subunit M [Microscillaceae bacterium]